MCLKIKFHSAPAGVRPEGLLEHRGQGGLMGVRVCGEVGR
ncbi:MAG: hypothetical protein JWO87_225, partial [Phycisphaerales bacterium]|nr:hypothetical protein [Phycisphaerales bacterium]